MNSFRARKAPHSLRVSSRSGCKRLAVMDFTTGITATTAGIGETDGAAGFAKRFAGSRASSGEGQSVFTRRPAGGRKTKTRGNAFLSGDFSRAGARFPRRFDEKTRTGLPVLAAPGALRGASRLHAAAEDEIAAGKAVPRTLEDGAFDGWMKGMRLRAAQAGGQADGSHS